MDVTATRSRGGRTPMSAGIPIRTGGAGSTRTISATVRCGGTSTVPTSPPHRGTPAILRPEVAVKPLEVLCEGGACDEHAFVRAQGTTLGRKVHGRRRAVRTTGTRTYAKAISPACPSPPPTPWSGPGGRVPERSSSSIGQANGDSDHPVGKPTRRPGTVPIPDPTSELSESEDSCSGRNMRLRGMSTTLL